MKRYQYVFMNNESSYETMSIGTCSGKTLMLPEQKGDTFP